MKILISYHSQTGNTQKVAQAIHSSLKVTSEIMPMDQVKDVTPYDVIILGFPLHNFGPSEKARLFLRDQTGNCKIILFATHAMPKEAPLMKTQLDRCREKVASGKLLGITSCRGTLSVETAQHMAESDDKRLRGFAQMQNESLNHPNPEEIEEVLTYINKIIDNLDT